MANQNPPPLLTTCVILTLLLITMCSTLTSGQDIYQMGAGIADITGPAADVSMMGYAKTGQDAAGIHIRLFARAFIFADEAGTRLCIVNADIGVLSQAVKLEVQKNLKQTYKGLYHEGNVLLSATHTHSGPGGYLQYVMYIISTQGFNRQSFDAIVSGILRSIARAHEMASRTKGSMYFNEGILMDASINRSPTAYLANPQEERAQYETDTDKQMYVLKLVSTDGTPIGMISWFAVHGTSMNNTNRLISGDNKGYAAQLFEKQMNPAYLPGKGPFVAAFMNSNEGDVSPNTMGPHCQDTGLTCDVATSTCGGQSPAAQKARTKLPMPNEKCVSPGPGRDMFESTQIIGEKQYEKARRLFETATVKIQGPLGYIHQYVDMSLQSVATSEGLKQTCEAAIGYSLAAGTTDGPGAFNFQQGATQSTPFWNLVRDFIKRPNQDTINCQYPKPILMPTGLLKFPYPWTPRILPTQILKLGSLLVAGLPAEFTTMSGRRMRSGILTAASKVGQFKVVLSGLSNAYSSYVTTPQEYQVQRYEGASTLFGINTLPAYIQQYMKLTEHLLKGTILADPGPPPPYLVDKQINLKPGVVYDSVPYGKRFGDPVIGPFAQYQRGGMVYVSFIAGHPRNDLQTERSFLTVERKQGDQWVIVAADANWETKFYWHRTSSIFGESQATILWDIPQDAQPGVYRIRHMGAAKSLLQQITPYVGVSREFQVV